MYCLSISRVSMGTAFLLTCEETEAESLTPEPIFYISHLSHSWNNFIIVLGVKRGSVAGRGGTAFRR